MAKVYEGATRSMLREARRLGKAKGAACADTQYLPGGGRDTAPRAAERATRILQGINDGDPAYDDVTACPDWLSGEWADEPLCRDIASACGIDEERDPDGETAREVCDVYCAAADEAYVAAIVRRLRSVAKEGA